MKYYCIQCGKLGDDELLAPCPPANQSKSGPPPGCIGWCIRCRGLVFPLEEIELCQTSACAPTTPVVSAPAVTGT